MTNLNQDETLGEAESWFLHKLIFILRLPCEELLNGYKTKQAPT